MSDFYKNKLKKCFSEYYWEYLSVIENGADAVNDCLAKNGGELSEEFINIANFIFVIAVVNERSDIVQLVVNRGADVDFEIYGKLPLQIAIENGDVDMARTLLENNANMNPLGGLYRDEAESYYGFINSMLGEAISRGHEEIALMLLNDSRLEIPDAHWKDWSLLCHAVFYGLPRLLKALLENEKADPNAEYYCSDHGYCLPLHMAIREDNLELAKILVEHEKTDVNWNSGDGGSVLEEVFSKGTVGMLRLLVNNGLVLNEDNIGIYSFNEDFNNVLMEYGCIVGSKDYKISGVPPLVLAANSGDMDNVNSALKDGARLDEVTSSKKNALMGAVGGGNDEIVEFLIEMQIDPNGFFLKFIEGKNTLAAVNLLEYGRVDVESRDEEGKTPIMLAYERKNADLVKLLIEKNADIETVDNYGNDLLQISRNFEDHGMTNFLVDFKDMKSFKNFQASRQGEASPIFGKVSYSDFFKKIDQNDGEEYSLRKNQSHWSCAPGGLDERSEMHQLVCLASGGFINDWSEGEMGCEVFMSPLTNFHGNHLQGYDDRMDDLKIGAGGPDGTYESIQNTTLCSDLFHL